ncbi:MAG: CHASE domain-containing protein, partial [Planctomycetales bacterium]|nr:CHASE domain-containing protein [Planctomycetales bacterium]
MAGILLASAVSLRLISSQRSATRWLAFAMTVLALASIAAWRLDRANDLLSRSVGALNNAASVHAAASPSLWATCMWGCVGLGILAFRRAKTAWFLLFAGAIGATATIAAYIISGSSDLGVSLQAVGGAHIAVLLAAGTMLSLRHVAWLEHHSRDDLSLELKRTHAMWLAMASIVFLGMTATGAAVHKLDKDARSTAQLRFLHLTERLVNDIRLRALQPVYGLHGARGLFVASQAVQRDEFRRYVASRDLEGEFPGALGFGYIAPVLRTQLDDFVAVERADDAPDFSVQSHSSQEAMYVVKYIEPLAPNASELGYDMASDAARYNAILEAIDSGLPTVSPIVEMQRTDGPTRAFYLFVPVYANDLAVATAAQRRGALQGILYAPISVSEAFGSSGALAEQRLDFEVFEGDGFAESRPLYDSDGHLASDAAEDLFERGSRSFHTIVPMEIGGRTWSVATSTLPAFDSASEDRGPTTVLICGELLTLMLLATVWSLSESRVRAIAMADDMTKELRASEEATRIAARRAEAANQAKTEFLANMSHEIRTP